MWIVYTAPARENYLKGCTREARAIFETEALALACIDAMPKLRDYRYFAQKCEAYFTPQETEELDKRLGGYYGLKFEDDDTYCDSGELCKGGRGMYYLITDYDTIRQFHFSQVLSIGDGMLRIKRHGK